MPRLVFNMYDYSKDINYSFYGHDDEGAMVDEVSRHFFQKIGQYENIKFLINEGLKSVSYTSVGPDIDDNGLYLSMDAYFTQIMSSKIYGSKLTSALDELESLILYIKNNPVDYINIWYRQSLENKEAIQIAQDAFNQASKVDVFSNDDTFLSDYFMENDCKEEQSILGFYIGLRNFLKFAVDNGVAVEVQSETFISNFKSVLESLEFYGKREGML